METPAAGAHAEAQKSPAGTDARAPEDAAAVAGATDEAAAAAEATVADDAAAPPPGVGLAAEEDELQGEHAAPKSKADWERTPPKSVEEALLAIEVGAAFAFETLTWCPSDWLDILRKLDENMKCVQWKVRKFNAKCTGAYALGGVKATQKKALITVVDVDYSKITGMFGRAGDPPKATLLSSIGYKDQRGGFQDVTVGARIIVFRPQSESETVAVVVLSMVKLEKRASVDPIGDGGGAKMTLNLTGALVAVLPLTSTSIRLMYVDAGRIKGLLGDADSAENAANPALLEALAVNAPVALPCVESIAGNGRARAKRPAAAGSAEAAEEEEEEEAAAVPRIGKRDRKATPTTNVETLGGGGGGRSGGGKRSKSSQPPPESSQRGRKRGSKPKGGATAAGRGAEAGKNATVVPTYTAAVSNPSSGEVKKLRGKVEAAVAKASEAAGALKEARAHATKSARVEAELRAEVTQLERANAVLESQCAAAAKGVQDERARGASEIKDAQLREGKARDDCMEMMKRMVESARGPPQQSPFYGGQSQIWQQQPQQQQFAQPPPQQQQPQYAQPQQPPQQQYAQPQQPPPPQQQYAQPQQQQYAQPLQQNAQTSVPLSAAKAVQQLTQEEMNRAIQFRQSGGGGGGGM